MATIFYLSALVILYVYVGYPAILALWAKLAPRRVERSAAAIMTPPVSIVVAARNEAATLEARIANLLSLDYPPDLVQIVVASDGSTDGTDAVLDRYADRIDVVRLSAGGKARALNAAVALATHEILVFADARQSFAPDALRALVAPFASPDIGCISGELVLDCEVDGQHSAMGDGVGFYWKYEKWLRRQESTVASMLGVTGAIYALRRTLWRPLPAETILDDVLTPMRVALAGFRVVFEPRARAFDRVAGVARDEFRRKTRTLAGNFQLLALEPQLLLPVVNPLWFQFLSHKVGRLVVPYALCLLLASSALLASQSAIYMLAFAGQIVFYGLALYGAVLHHREHLLTPRPSVSSV
jgi:cellulose synthase/poly-beta-1,6-N-acetylglucosamine synthase-like glycosyltransferase